ncbi:acyl-CoA oxidase [Streptomyces sp. LRE541]|uniref:acyl-CoA dehydrogenase family protein n=1 Tax=Streptomyces sp. LRE541 TaxID=2931983 RepID=UPI002010155C|nr:acyl-CoA dehydrogenase [Streptomyces sp. LRE541]UPZ29608.1 acyl-CoA oxidase [Streptomyces sp. LRE541]
MSVPAHTKTHPVADELARLLFEDADRERVHGPWRRLVRRQEFAYRAELSPQERTALSYERLRLLNEAVGDPVALAADPYRLAGLHEWTGPVDGGLTTLASIHYNLFLGSVLDHDGGHDRDLSPFTSLQRTGTFLCTELEHGNDVASMETVAVFDRVTGGFRLTTPTEGAQKFMPNTSLTGGPKTAVVAARLLVDGEDRGTFLFLTPLSDESGHLPGVRVRPLPQRTGTPVDHCLTAFDQVWLPRSALLEAEHGRLAADGTLTSSLGNRRKRLLRSINRVTMGKLCMSAGTLGMSRAALTIAVRYAHSRLVAGPKAGERIPVAAHRSHHGRLLHALATAYAMTFLHRSTVSRFAGHAAEERAEVEREVAVAKGWITWQARAITTECRERCGAQGLFPANGLADLPLNIEGGITAEGDNLVIWVKAASEMVFGHQVTRRAATEALGPSGDPDDPGDRGGTGDPGDHGGAGNSGDCGDHGGPGNPGDPGGHGGPGDPGDLRAPYAPYPAYAANAANAPRDREITELPFLRDLLADVERIWQDRARAALREGPSGDPVGRWNVTSDAALEMVSAHARLRAADAFLAAIARTTDPRAGHLMRNLCRLFLLRELGPHTGDLLAEGRLTADHVRGLPKAVDTVLGDLAPHLMTLVDAFDLPAEVLSSIPIASGGSVGGTTASEDLVGAAHY